MSSAAADSDCIICLDSDPPPIQSGCACRGDGGLAHVGCLTEKAVSQQAYRGNEVWWKCQTCGQTFTGAVRFGLAAEWCRLVTPRCESGRGPVPDSRQIGARIGARFPIPGKSGPGARDQAQIGARARDRARERNGNLVLQ
jgi:hypothetical protein